MYPIDCYEIILYEFTHEEICELYDTYLDVNKPDEFGDYLLNVACQYSQIDNVQFFITKGANLESIDSNSDTPLLVTIDYAHNNPTAALQIVQILLDNGANIECRGFMEKTPFLKACTRVNLDMIKLLVSRGCNVRAVTEEPGGYEYDGLTFAKIFKASREVKEYLKAVIRETKRNETKRNEMMIDPFQHKVIPNSYLWHFLRSS